MFKCIYYTFYLICFGILSYTSKWMVSKAQFLKCWDHLSICLLKPGNPEQDKDFYLCIWADWTLLPWSQHSSLLHACHGATRATLHQLEPTANCFVFAPSYCCLGSILSAYSYTWISQLLSKRHSFPESKFYLKKKKNAWNFFSCQWRCK